MSLPVIQIIETKMDCSKCHSQCLASCCSCAAPIPKDIYERNKDKIVTQPIEIFETEGQDINLKDEIAIIALTEHHQCIFLNIDLSCNIYEDRPWICRKFGDESHPFLTCSYQSKDGRVRSRQERRAIERETAKTLEKNTGLDLNQK